MNTPQPHSAAEPLLPAAPAQPESNIPTLKSSRAARWGLLAMALALGGFFLWASLAPLNSGVPAAAQVVVETKRHPVQHLTGGIVQAVRVREGDVVQTGQPLFELDGATARANYEAVRQRLHGLRAVQSRLLAEKNQSSSVTFPPELQLAATDPLIQQQMHIQQQLFLTRRSALRAELAAIEEGIRGQEASIQAFDGIRLQRRQQLALLQQELTQTSALVAEGFAPRNRQLELERAQADIQASLLDLEGNHQRARSSIAELRQRALARQQQQQEEIENQITSVNLEVQTDASRYLALKEELQRTRILAPASGQVVGLQVTNVGGVIQPGQVLLSIVPVGEPLLLDAQIAPHLIDRLRTGQITDVRFTTFIHDPQLVVQGEVVSLSKDILTDERTGLSHYLARVQITPSGMETLGQRRMQPGMPAEVIVITGERTLLTYLLGPLTRRVAASMTEE